jgi:hypothetical protein
MRAGIANGTSFVVLNLVCLVIALVASNELWRREFELDSTTRLVLAVVLLLWWPVFRLAINPISDIVFLALSTTSILVAMVTGRSLSLARRAGGAIIAFVLAFAAFKVRTVGIALVPAIAWAALARPEQMAWARKQITERPGRLAVVAAVLLGIAAFDLSRSQYVTGDLKTQFGRGGLWATLVRTWGYRLTEFGELALNVPAGKLPNAVQPIISAFGAGCVVLLGWLFWRRRRAIGPVEVFALGVAGIMFIWPYHSARFWIPAFPAFLGLCAWGARHAISTKLRPALPAAIVALFLTMGIVGEIYNTRISVTPARFLSRVSDDDYMGPAYREALGVRTSSDTMPVDSTVLRLLRRYEPRARRH